MAEDPKKLPPHDSWIALAPGETIVIDAAFQQKWHQKAAAMRTVRGHVLALCYEVEFSLDTVIARTFFADRGNDQAAVDRHRDVFDELLLKSSVLAFRSKIELFRRMRARFDILAEYVSLEMIKKLHEIRNVRNRFAHQPVSFKQITLPSGDVDIVGTLEGRDASTEITETYLNAFDRVVDEVRQGLRKTNEQIGRKGTSREPGA